MVDGTGRSRFFWGNPLYNGEMMFSPHRLDAWGFPGHHATQRAHKTVRTSTAKPLRPFGPTRSTALLEAESMGIRTRTTLKGEGV